jgi:L-threonylcarbamoyladenylate synthase
MSRFYNQSELNKTKIKEIGLMLKKGQIGVFLSDTIYGIFTSALNKNSIEKIYTIRKRSIDKPMIILISSFVDLEFLGISVTQKIESILKKVWPGPVSVILDCESSDLKYLHRGTNSLAFRIPNNEFLLSLLNESGPLVAPSANFEGDSPAPNITLAKQYFGDEVDFYIDGGEAPISKPSTLIKIVNDEIELLREGAVKWEDLKS